MLLPTQPGTAPWYVSDRINTREQACTYIPLCFAALIVQLQLHASYPDYCCMHRVCAASREVRLQACKVIQTDRTHPTGYIVSDSILVILGNLFGPYSYLLLSAGCCVATACTVCAACPHRYRLQGMSEAASTHANKRAYDALPCCAKAVQGKLVSCSCLQVNLATAGCTGLCTVNTASCRLHCMLRSNT
jgi:hypothetical protein